MPELPQSIAEFAGQIVHSSPPHKGYVLSPSGVPGAFAFVAIRPNTPMPIYVIFYDEADRVWWCLLGGLSKALSDLNGPRANRELF
jgi:hypothetical protein